MLDFLFNRTTFKVTFSFRKWFMDGWGSYNYYPGILHNFLVDLDELIEKENLQETKVTINYKVKEIRAEGFINLKVSGSDKNYRNTYVNKLKLKIMSLIFDYKIKIK